MPLKLRIIPLTIVVASMFLMMKVVALIQGGQELSESLLVSRVQAEDKPAEKPKEETPADSTAKDTAPKAADDKAPAKEGDKAATKGADKPASNVPVGPDGKPIPNVSTDPGDISDRRFTNVELELLQKLSKRREELDAWEANLQIKETALNATEKRIDDKILQVEAMKKAVSDALAEYNKIEDQQVSSLVKIYENMKPADASRIFNQLDRPILLLIVNRMQEKKAAPILAGMDPQRAKQVTIDLADQRRLKSNAVGNNPNNQAALTSPTSAIPPEGGATAQPAPTK